MLEKNIVSINCNVGSGGGKVMLGIAETARKAGYNYYTFSPETRQRIPDNHSFCTSRKTHFANMKISKLTGFDNATLKISTINFIKKLKDLKPDLIHLHGLHGGYIDYKLLFEFIEEMNIPVVWTQHDCWAFTGSCTHFTVAECDKWKTGCEKCPQLKQYPQSLIFDNSKPMYNYKKNVFTGHLNLTIVGVSKWMEKILNQSFLNEYPIITIENGVNINTFQYQISDYKADYDINNKFLILGVASSWNTQKGMNEFVKLRALLPNEMYSIVLIGLSDAQIKECESLNIIGIKKTENVNELIKWYSACDVFFNPSMEETFGLVTTEAMACGAPVIVYNTTASPELVENTDCFCVMPYRLDEVKECIKVIQQNKKENFNEKSIEKVRSMYDQDKQYQKYIELYDSYMKN